MKDKIINLAVIIGMSIFANYPLYHNLKSTAKEMDTVIETVQSNVNALQEAINTGVVQAEDALKKIKDLEDETNKINNKLDSLKNKAVNKVKKMIDFKI